VYAVRGKRRRKKQEANGYETTANKTAHFVAPCSGTRKLRLDETRLLRPFTGSRLPKSTRRETGCQLAVITVSTSSYSNIPRVADFSLTTRFVGVRSPLV
jgi:hypothetical protein